MHKDVASPQFTLASLTLPVAVGYIPIGIVFGFLFVQAGGSGALAMLSSLLIYAGAAQFMMIPMLAAQLPVGAIVLATFVLNLRHVFYGLSLLDTMPRRAWQRWYAIFALTDETWSVLSALPAATRARHTALLSALNQLWWVLGTGIGVLLGVRAQLSLTGLDFVLAALFAVLALEQWRHRKQLLPVWIAIGSYALALWLAPGQALALAIGLAVAATLLRAHPFRRAARP